MRRISYGQTPGSSHSLRNPYAHPLRSYEYTDWSADEARHVDKVNAKWRYEPRLRATPRYYEQFTSLVCAPVYSNGAVQYAAMRCYGGSAVGVPTWRHLPQWKPSWSCCPKEMTWWKAPGYTPGTGTTQGSRFLVDPTRYRGTVHPI